MTWERPRSRISAQVRRSKKAFKKSEASDESSTPDRTTRSYSITSSHLPQPLTPHEAHAKWLGWFESKGWTPFRFQTDSWRAFEKGSSGLISVPTGSGKTFAAFGGPLMSLLEHPSSALTTIYVSPLKALARDIAEALRVPIRELGLPYHVELRTGDTTQSTRSRMRESLPQILVITPESLALMLTSSSWEERFGSVRSIVLDEWHVLMGTKRGALLELTLSRLRSVAKNARTWALSATLSNLEEAAESAAGAEARPSIIRESIFRPIEVRSLLPRDLTAFPWFGHSGLRQLQLVIDAIDSEKSTLVFTNTRSQAEKWYQSLRDRMPEWDSTMALHHGSLNREERERVENGIKSGELKLVVATSSLDLGVDFPQVERIIQIGSMKGFDRAIQRAGRAFHRPGEKTAIEICPTHLFEILEISGLREGLKSQSIEARPSLRNPLDVLVQFLLNSAFANGFDADELFDICRKTMSFRNLARHDFDWALAFVTRGGASLQAYPQFQKLVEQDGRFRFSTPRHARQHRLNMGTIVSDAGVLVKFARGERLGTIDESFISRLNPGDTFIFAGRNLKLVQLRDMVAHVRLSKDKSSNAAVWSGTSFPISASLASFLREELDKVSRVLDLPDESTDKMGLSTELVSFLPVARRQMNESSIPRKDEVLVEIWPSKEGHHLFFYGFEGRLVHEGLGHLAAYRLARINANTISVAANDYGIDMLSSKPLAPPENLTSQLKNAFSGTDELEDDIELSLNYNELAKSSFREIARIAGLLQQSYPGQAKTTRHLQMSSSLLFDVLSRYEPDHPLLNQAFLEVRERQLQIERLMSLMEVLKRKKWIVRVIDRPSPFSFPLLIERINSRVTTESFEDRIKRMQKQLEVST